MLATNLSEANGPDDKLRMAFKMYDKDSSGDQWDQCWLESYLFSSFFVSSVIFLFREALMEKKR